MDESAGALHQLLLPAVQSDDPVETSLLGERVRRALGRGLPCRGVVQLLCPSCDTRRQVHFRCPGGCSVCPARAHRRGLALARSLPRVPVRHWTLSLPSELRGRLQADADLARGVTRTFMRAVFAEIRRTAGLQTGLPRDSLRCGGASLLHRVGSTLNLNPHLHAVVLDGVYSEIDEEFVPITVDPNVASMRAVASEVRDFLDRTLGFPIGRTPEPDPLRARRERAIEPARDPEAAAPAPLPIPDAPPTSPSESVGAPNQGPVRPTFARPEGRSVAVLGVDVHVAPPIAADDRASVFRLSHYVARPPIDLDAIETTSTGNVSVRLDRPLSDGTTHLELTAAELAERLAMLVPTEPQSRVSYHGVLAPRAADRWRVVPTQLTLVESARVKTPGSERSPAAPPPSRETTDLAAALVCECGTSMKVVGVEEESDLG